MQGLGQVAYADRLYLVAAQQTEDGCPVDPLRYVGQLRKVEHRWFAGEEIGHAAKHHVEGVGEAHGLRVTDVGGHYRQAGAFELDQFALQGSVGHMECGA